MDEPRTSPEVAAAMAAESPLPLWVPARLTRPAVIPVENLRVMQRSAPAGQVYVVGTTPAKTLLGAVASIAGLALGGWAGYKLIRAL